MAFFSSPEFLLVLFLILLIVVAFVYVLFTVVPVMPFLYANAIVQSRSRKLIPESKMQNLIDCKSTKEFADSLQDTDYSNRLKGAKTITEVHQAVENTFLETIDELYAISPKKIRSLLDAYLMFYEVKVLKNLYKQKVMPKSFEALQEYIFPIGNIRPRLLEALQKTEDLTEMMVIMRESVYKEVFTKEYKNALEFDVSLDNFVLQHFMKVSKKSKMYDAKIMAAIMNTRFDIQNLLLLLQSLIRKSDQKGELMIKNETVLSRKSNELIAAESVEDFVEATNQTQYYDSMKKAFDGYSKDKSFSHFETWLMRYYKEFVISKDLHHIQGPFPLISFITKNEIEKRNLLIISKAITARFSREETMGLII